MHVQQDTKTTFHIKMVGRWIQHGSPYMAIRPLCRLSLQGETVGQVRPPRTTGLEAPPNHLGGIKKPHPPENKLIFMSQGLQWRCQESRHTLWSNWVGPGSWFRDRALGSKVGSLRTWSAGSISDSWFRVTPGKDVHLPNRHQKDTG